MSKAHIAALSPLFLACMLLTPTPVHAQDNNDVTNLTSLVNRDWVQVTKQKIGDKGAVFEYWYRLSLRPFNKVDNGDVWMIKQQFNKSNGVTQLASWVALQGKYVMANEKLKDNILLMKIWFTKEFSIGDVRRTGLKLQWRQKRDYWPQAVHLEIPLEGTRTVPKDKIRLKVTEFYYVDEKGDHRFRFEKGLFGKERKLDFIGDTPFLELRETLTWTEEFLIDDVHVPRGLPNYKTRSGKEPPPLPKDDSFARGLSLHKQGKYDKAIAAYTQAWLLNITSKKPTKDPSLYYNRGLCYAEVGNDKEALRDYHRANDIKRDATFCNAIGWLYATCPDSHERSGKAAVYYATEACKISGWKSPFYFDTLAAAYAEKGDSVVPSYIGHRCSIVSGFQSGVSASGSSRRPSRCSAACWSMRVSVVSRSSSNRNSNRAFAWRSARTFK